MATNDGTGRTRAHHQQPTGWLLFEHDDGRKAVCRDGEQRFTDGDPGWHRIGPVEMRGLAIQPSQSTAGGGTINPALDDAAHVFRQFEVMLRGIACVDLEDALVDVNVMVHAAADLAGRTARRFDAPEAA